MSGTFYTYLARRALEVDSLLCIGLDPHSDDLPAPAAVAARDFCLRIIEATWDLVAAYKPNAAFFEVFGSTGIEALREVIAGVPEGIPVILDAKRGDIASTARAYAQAAFETLGADAITISPYLGYDSIAPFLEDPSHGAFLLCKTSNPGSADLQDLPLRALLGSGGYTAVQAVYEAVALRANKWNANQNIGLVVGATHPEALARVRRLSPDLWILAPGVGAQGGNLAAAIQAGARQDGLGMLVPVSRGISRADDPRGAAQSLRQAINAERAKVETASTIRDKKRRSLEFDLALLADGLLEAGCVKFGEFTLKSGLVSPIYIDLRRLTGFPELLSRVASAYLPLLNKLSFDRLAALPYAALPITTAISLQTGWPMVYPRKEAKGYGTQAEIEGIYSPGERVVVIDDLATTGGSKFEAIDKLTTGGLAVKGVVVLIDRQSGAPEALATAGYQMQAVFTLTQLLDYWQATVKVPTGRIQAVRDFLSAQS